MTTKDQAIGCVAKDGYTILYFQEELLPFETDLYISPPPAPDCRTCTDYDRLEGCLRAPRYAVCTNGDQYQPAPKVVLWRTE